MDLGLKDRVAIIGGASRGIGRAIAAAFAKEGACVTICARNEADLRRTELELARIGTQHHVMAIPADLSVPRDNRRVVRDTVNRFGHIEILVTHLGYEAEGRPSELNDESIMTALEHNFLSAVRLSREVIPYMKQQRWGRIVHLLPGEVRRPAEGSALATSSHLALLGYSKMLANELARFNITVNNVLSGPIQTEHLMQTLAEQAGEKGMSAEELIKEAVADIPMQRMGTPEEVSALVTFIASERAGYLTGSNIILDGGMTQTIR